MGVGGQHHALAALPPKNIPVPNIQKAGWTPGPFWTGEITTQSKENCTAEHVWVFW
jgi:hypothetical protein